MLESRAGQGQKLHETRQRDRIDGAVREPDELRGHLVLVGVTSVLVVARQRTVRRAALRRQRGRGNAQISKDFQISKGPTLDIMGTILFKPYQDLGEGLFFDN